jgi:leucyl aminopeptidase
MKLTRVYLENLQNEEWFTYQTFLIKLVKKNESVKTALAALLALIEKNNADADNALEIIRKSQLTTQIDEADALRDRSIGALNNYTRSFLYDTDTDKQRAAQNLMVVIEHYKAMPKAPQDQESSMIINFVEELEENHADDMAAIGLEDRKDQLKEANEQFIQLVDQRTIEAGDQTTLRMVDVRREGNQLIRHLYSQTEMLLMTAPTDALTQFANELNAENRRVNGNLNRKG